MDKPKKLNGFPKHETVNFKLTCLTEADHCRLGQVEALLTVQVKGGNSYSIVLRANVVTPEIELSSEKLDYGRIIVGQCKVLTVQLHNVRDVPCEWQAGSKISRSNRDYTAFSAVPESGVLRSGERVNVDIRFHSHGAPEVVHQPPHPHQQESCLPHAAVQGRGGGA